MIGAVFVAVALMQGVEVTASVNRTRLTVGEEVVVTVRARTNSAEPVELLLPPLAGFAIAGSRDVTEVSMSGAAGAVRTTVRELRLRAEQSGALLIGPVRARQGGSLVSTDPILVTVDSAASGGAVALSPIARDLLASAPPPPRPPPGRTDPVALTIMIPDDTVLPGQQVDLLAVAWVPREVRQRMRAPALTLTIPEGVWAYPPTASAGVAASRQVGGVWMDLFVVHQIVFPLAPGRIVVPPAAVDYAVPVSFSLFTREERFTLRSDSVAIVVRPLPAAGRPADDQGVVGGGVSFDVRATPAVTRVGEPLDVAATVSGIGNVSLWPPPAIQWPAGFRVYPAETEVRLAPVNGRVAGTKTFHFLAVPDSGGRFVLAETRYPYYDIVAGRYDAAGSAPRGVTVAAGTEPRAARSLPPLLPRRGAGAGIADRVARRLAPAGWLAVFLVPPLAAWAVRWRQRRIGRADREGEGDGGRRAALTRLGALEREFVTILANHVPDAFARDGDGVVPALRAAGIDNAVADHVRRLRDRLRAARYGPRGLGDAAELAAEIEQVLAVLGSGPGPTGRRRRSLTALGLLLVAVAPLARAQGPSAEALYEAGALRAAADSFAARAAAEPAEAAHWYNLGAALYRAGADGKAVAAWTVAARVAPRDAVVRRARRLLAPSDPVSERLLEVEWATPGEWGLLSAAAWAGLWIAALGRRRRTWLAALAVVAVGCGVVGAREARRRASPVVVVTAEGQGAAVRAAPYGGASAAATIPPGGAAMAGRSYGAWVEVRRADGIRGWVLASELVRL